MPYQSVFRPDLFEGQTIIVTGGGSGIGRCTAHELASLGAHVALVGRTAEKLAEVKAEIERGRRPGHQRMSATSATRRWSSADDRCGAWHGTAGSTAWSTTPAASTARR